MRRSFVSSSLVSFFTCIFLVPKKMDTNVYLKNLKVIQRIRDIAGGLSLNLPQICVVGDQSSGKSSVLKLITGVDFPVNAGTCTKCAIVVECKQDGTDERYEIQNVSTKE